MARKGGGKRGNATERVGELAEISRRLDREREREREREFVPAVGKLARSRRMKKKEK